MIELSKIAQITDRNADFLERRVLTQMDEGT